MLDMRALIKQALQAARSLCSALAAALSAGWGVVGAWSQPAGMHKILQFQLVPCVPSAPCQWGGQWAATPHLRAMRKSASRDTQYQQEAAVPFEHFLGWRGCQARQS
jgi:hypothetical protein